MSLPELESKCWRCWGAGVVPAENHSQLTGCPECGGIGWIPTEDGQRLLEFLRRHLPLEVEQEDEFMP